MMHLLFASKQWVSTSSRLTPPCQTGKRQLQTRKRPKYCAHKKNKNPRTMPLNRMLRLPPRMTFSWCTTPAKQFALCHCLRQPCQCDLQKTRSTTGLKRCACHENWTWRSPKCCTGHEKSRSPSKNLSKVFESIAPPTQSAFGALSHRWECHEVPRLSRKTMLHVFSL